MKFDAELTMFALDWWVAANANISYAAITKTYKLHHPEGHRMEMFTVNDVMIYILKWKWKYGRPRSLVWTGVG